MKELSECIGILDKGTGLGDVEAHYNLSIMYREGEGVEKDMKKYTYYMEEAAIAGHPTARHNLGVQERNNGRFERAVKHFVIAANLGSHDSLKLMKKLFEDGYARKEDYATALRAYQDAVEATKSAERGEAEAYFKAVKAAEQQLSK